MSAKRRLWMSLLAVTLTAAAPGSGAAQAWSYKDAAKPYAGRSITVLDEVTPLQENMRTLVPEFEKATGIKVDYQLLNHFEVISKGQADMLSGRGAYDAVMLHSPQMGLLLDAAVIRPIDDLVGNKALTNPGLDRADFIQPAADSLTKFRGKTYGFLNWNYNVVYWARGDLFGHPEEKAAFKKKYGYDLAPAKTLQQMRDIAEFFTRKKGEKLAGQTLDSDFYGIVMEGIKGGTTLWTVLNAFVKNFGGDIFDAEGKPTVNRPENVAAVKFWAGLWKFSPPGQAEYSLIDVPTVMGNGIAAQTLAWSDFVLGIDQPGKSKLAGKFVYAGSPANAQGTKRSAETEPSGIVISKHSKQPEATYLFLQWMVDKSTQQMLFDKSGGAGVPVRASTWALPSVKQSKFAGLYVAMQDSLKYGTAKPKAPKLFEIMDVLVGLVQEVGLGKKSADQALKEGQEKVMAICSKCTL
ncbi:MAG TPA: extracellular solute-binding protein [Methylomirabilota bacterium]|nr:extracellular solute-binding protein [Methylomirabilota bacterium]